MVAPRSWTFVTNHAQVLLFLSRNPDARVGDIAAAAQITERATYRILDDLEGSGYITRTRRGRRNRYGVNLGRPLADPVVEAQLVADLLSVLPRGDTEAHVSLGTGHQKENDLRSVLSLFQEIRGETAHPTNTAPNQTGPLGKYRPARP